MLLFLRDSTRSNVIIKLNPCKTNDSIAFLCLQNCLYNCLYISFSTKGTYTIDEETTEKFVYTLSLVCVQCVVNYFYAEICRSFCK